MRVRGERLGKGMERESVRGREERKNKGDRKRRGGEEGG